MPAIVTLTLNPALDISLHVDAVVPQHKIRTDPPRYDPGGGGLNVSRVCRRLGEPTTTIAPVGGPPGQRMLELLNADTESDGSANDVRMVPIQGDTRQSITVLGRQSGDEYRFVLPGPSLSPEEIDTCRTEVLQAAESCRCLVVSGSMPPGVDDGFVEDLVDQLDDCLVIVDTSGSALRAALTSRAYLVKPSARELASLVDADLITEADVTSAAHEVMGWANVEVLVVSIGAGGSIIVTDDETFRLRAPTVQVRSAVGAGDSMVAGMAVGIHRGLDLPQAVALGIAAGSAAVLTDGTELCRAADVERLLPLVQMN